MLGDTAVAVHPDDERYKTLVGKNVILPLVGRKIPIIADDYSDPEKGSGAVKITPAHDFNDFEVGKRHNLPQINIFRREAKLIRQRCNDAFFAGVPPSAELDETVELARSRPVRCAQTDRGAARRKEHSREDRAAQPCRPAWRPFQRRDRAVSHRPMVRERQRSLAKPAIAAVREGKTNFVPNNWESTYFNWMENIQPWCISRQLWWGHQIPAWYGAKKAATT